MKLKEFTIWGTLADVSVSATARAGYVDVFVMPPGQTGQKWMNFHHVRGPRGARVTAASIYAKAYTETPSPDEIEELAACLQLVASLDVKK